MVKLSKTAKVASALMTLIWCGSASAIECPDAGAAKGQVDSSEYFSLPGPEFMELDLSENIYWCFSELIVLARAGRDPGKNLIESLGDADLGRTVRRLILTPASEITLSSLLKDLTNAGNERLWLHVLSDLKSGISVVVDETDPDTLSSWKPEFPYRLTEFTEAIDEMSNKPIDWEPKFAEWVKVMPGAIEALEKTSRDLDIERLAPWLKEIEPDSIPFDKLLEQGVAPEVMAKLSSPEQARDVLLERVDRAASDALMTFITELPCTTLLAAGVGSRADGSGSEDQSAVVEAVNERLKSGECAHRGLNPHVVGEVVFNEDGSYCFECYSEYSARLVEWLEELEGIQAQYEQVESPSETLEKLDDFRGSSTGMLIHEECFEPGRWKFDVEKAVVEALVTTFRRFIELESLIMEDTERGSSAIVKLHVPDFVNLYDSDKWRRSDIFRYELTTHDGSIVERKDSREPCKDLRGFAEARDIDLKEGKRCRFAKHIEQKRPKLFCEIDEFVTISETHSVEGNAYASNPSKPLPFIKNHQGRTTIYQPPNIVFNSKNTRSFTSARFQSSLVHEHFHNFGWEDFSRSHNSYSYFCQVAVFYKTHEDVLDSYGINVSIEGCIDSEYRDNNIRWANHINERVVGDKD